MNMAKQLQVMLAVLALTVGAGHAAGQPAGQGKGATGGLIDTLPADPADKAAPNGQQGFMGGGETTNWGEFLSGKWFAEGHTIDNPNGMTRFSIIFQGDEYKMEIPQGMWDLTIVGHFAAVPSAADPDQATLTLTPVNWSPKKHCDTFTNRCGSTNPPNTPPTSIEKIDDNTFEIASRNLVFHRPRM